MHTHHHLVDALLSCGTLDSGYLLSLIDAYDLDAFELLEDVRDFLWDKRPTANHLIYVALERVAQMFLTQEVKHRARRFASAEYTIFINYLDSHLWFEDQALNRWFEAWRKV